jgi:hypothetical protein
MDTRNVIIVFGIGCIVAVELLIRKDIDKASSVRAALLVDNKVLGFTDKKHGHVHQVASSRWEFERYQSACTTTMIRYTITPESGLDTYSRER